MEEAKLVVAPMSSTIKLNKNEDGISVDIKKYKRMIGSLLYLIASKPDIMLSVRLRVRFQSVPKESNLKIVKRIIRYLKGTPALGLFYLKDDMFTLTTMMQILEIAKLTEKVQAVLVSC